MKTILVDAVNGIVNPAGEINSQMISMLDSFENPKIVVTGAKYEDFEKYSLNTLPYKVFTLQHDPEKSDPEYYKIMLEELSLSAEDVVLFEHKQEAVKSARSLGIKTYLYDPEVADIDSLKEFIAKNV